MVSALSKALKHSGTLVTTNVQMRALQVPDGLSGAYNFRPKPDTQMPPFEAKVDQDNLLKMLPAGSLKPHQLCLQRVTFMSTDWLGLRLAHGTHSQCISFCLCVTALQNIGKNTSRSVVVETSSDEAIPFGFACAPTFGNKKSHCSTAFVDHAEGIGELAQIFANEDGNAQKKVMADLKKWCQKHQRKLSGNDISSDEAPRPGKSFSLRSLFASIEEALGALGAEGHANASKQGSAGSRRNSNTSMSGSSQDRRKSLPPTFGKAAKASPRSSAVSPRSSQRQPSKPKRSHDLNQSHQSDLSQRPLVSERRRRNSDPGLVSMMGLSEKEAVIAMKIKRKKSLDGHSITAIMPTLNEDDDSASEDEIRSGIFVPGSSPGGDLAERRSETQSSILTAPSILTGRQTSAQS
jgi:hypothetical protein